jgi:hypothetical protein
VDNLRCRGQRIAIPPGRYDWVYALAAAERRTEDRVAVRYHDGTVRRGWLRVSDFWPETGARFGEVLAFRCASMHYPRHVQENMAPAIWRTRMALPDPGVVVGLDLPDNPALHIFALTLVAEPSSLVSKED